MSLTHERQLRIISRAWGRQKGYCFFPWIDRDEQAKGNDRRAGFHEGPDRPRSDPLGHAFRWPEDREAILEHMEAHTEHDLYWCPSLFEYPVRRSDAAMDEHALWADLDEVDPRAIQEYEPTIAWETSPGRYQALWLLASGDIQGASWPGNENQRLTYLLGADAGGWDTTQLLRIPGWVNHKGHYDAPRGELLWDRGRTYQPDEFEELPQVSSHRELADVSLDLVEAVDREKVLARIRLKLPKATRELLSARSASGDRSNALWRMERDLADVGCTVPEIVAIVRSSAWNKYATRADELTRLFMEAAKAIAQRPAEVENAITDEREERPKPIPIALAIQNVTKPEWLVENIWARGSCGFLAGQPKTWKSWSALDLAFSVATGMDFLGHFKVTNPGPVLYIQEEDSLPMIKQRVNKIWPGKKGDRITTNGNGEIVWEPADDIDFDPAVNAYIQNGFVVSDEAWQIWLDETLEEGMRSTPYELLIIDTLMMVAGDVEENRAQEMTTKVFRPLKSLARKHGTAIAVVHHMRKSDPRYPQRGGQLMLGSVANHAWSEDSLYMKLGPAGSLVVETESKHAPSRSFRINNLRNRNWSPVIDKEKGEENDIQLGEVEVRSANAEPKRRGRPARAQQPVIASLKRLGDGVTTGMLANATGISYQQANRQLVKAAGAGQCHKLKDGHHTRWHIGPEQ